MEIEKGLVYEVDHIRKGKFLLLILSNGDEWVIGKIVSGSENAIIDENAKFEGEAITVRKSFCDFKPTSKNIK